MSLALVEDAGGDPRNAQYLALASDLSYLPMSTGAQAFKEQLGLDVRLFTVGNTQAYVAANDQHIVVVFRGTEAPTGIEGLKDWLLTDAMNLLIVPEGRLGTDLAAAGVGARFHQGFVNAIADIWDPVLATTSEEIKKKDRPLWITGHSLGGALALFAAWLFQRRTISVHQIYTYGGPMIGNAAAAQAFDREFEGKIFRYVGTLDPVPKLPTMSLVANMYGHCNKEMALGTAVAAGSAMDFLEQMAAKAVDGVLNATIIDDIWRGLQERIGAHAMENYRIHLK